jgi:cytidine deaminase
MDRMDPTLRRALIDAAIEARTRSYSPYSHFQVGAALLCADGTIVPGTNVENAAYSPSVCAERSAVVGAVSLGKREFTAIAVVGHETDLTPPCGVCRQTLAEFADDLLVILGNLKGDVHEFHLKELLPDAFLPARLKG